MINDNSSFINSENSKYVDGCAMIMYFYLKSDDEKINIDEVAEAMDGNAEDNLVIIKRILGGLDKKVRFKNVPLSYSDYLWLDQVVKSNKSYRFQLFPFIFSVGAFCISFFTLILSGVGKPVFMLFSIALALMLIYYIYKISD